MNLLDRNIDDIENRAPEHWVKRFHPDEFRHRQQLRKIRAQWRPDAGRSAADNK